MYRLLLILEFICRYTTEEFDELCFEFGEWRRAGCSIACAEPAQVSSSTKMYRVSASPGSSLSAKGF